MRRGGSSGSVEMRSKEVRSRRRRWRAPMTARLMALIAAWATGGQMLPDSWRNSPKTKPPSASPCPPHPREKRTGTADSAEYPNSALRPETLRDSLGLPGRDIGFDSVEPGLTQWHPALRWPVTMLGRGVRRRGNTPQATREK